MWSDVKTLRIFFILKILFTSILEGNWRHYNNVYKWIQLFKIDVKKNKNEQKMPLNLGNQLLIVESDLPLVTLHYCIKQTFIV